MNNQIAAHLSVANESDIDPEEAVLVEVYEVTDDGEIELAFEIPKPRRRIYIRLPLAAVVDIAVRMAREK